jgi:hypothetical protein
MSERPAPFTPANADLNGYDFMPLFGELLRTSNFNAKVSDAGFRAAINLWWGAWLQVPAASLPDDEAVMCRLADLGRDLKAWRRVRDEAMSGFVLCSDGRWYHGFLAPKAIAAWEERQNAIKRGKASGVARKLRKGQLNQSQAAKASADNLETLRTSSVDAVETETNKGRGREKLTNTASTVRDTPAPPSAPPEADPPQPQVNPEATAKITAECTRAKLENPTPTNPIIARWIRTGRTPSQVTKALAEATRAHDAPQPLTAAYVDPILTRIASLEAKAQHSAQARVDATQDIIAAQRSLPPPSGIPPSLDLPTSLRKALKPKDDSNAFETFGT